jgi:hypothetical protein
VWEARDDTSATATLTHGDTSVSLVFHFSDEDEVERVHTDTRYREVDGTYELTPWTGHFEAYKERDGVRVPTAASVEWNLPDGDLSYWRATLDEFDYWP